MYNSNQRLSPNILGSMMDPQQANEGRPCIFFSSILFKSRKMYMHNKFTRSYFGILIKAFRKQSEVTVKVIHLPFITWKPIG